jgi:Protein of unknown function (DUF1778)
MAKAETLILRMETTMKDTIKKAAEHVGETMTEFATTALMDRAEKVLARPRRTLPAYFRALAAQAAAGGGGNWQTVGHQFAQACVPDLRARIGIGRAEKELDRLERLAAGGAVPPKGLRGLAGVLGWFEEHFLDCVELIPERRREAFALGAQRRADEDGIDRD